MTPGATPHPAMIAPFVVLLGAIALGPLVAPAWWARHYAKAALGLGALAVAYYLGWLGAGERVGHAAHEYISFISLIGSLFIVSGGIHLRVKGEATPAANVLFLAMAAVAANLLGTTGASMIFIRPWLRMNSYRLTGMHLVFFIFIVSNVGGGLTPIGDPPLFLGYLRGIPFWWVARNAWHIWAVALSALLLIFYFLDRRNYLRAPPEIRREHAEGADQWHCAGLTNLFFLGAILGAVFINHPPLVREGIMWAAALGSYFTTRQAVHAANDFNFHPVKEVAVLFAGIFATMMPALDWLELHAREIAVATPGFFYWACGGLSSVLDNAPTYLSFLHAIFGIFVDPAMVAELQNWIASGADPAALSPAVQAAGRLLLAHPPGTLAALSREAIELAILLSAPATEKFVVAISVASVFFGAATYIGNGPNFMVKAVAEQFGMKTPSFIAYVTRYTLPCLLPVLALIWWLFFR